jgi:4-phytase/acid phosphatase
MTARSFMRGSWLAIAVIAGIIAAAGAAATPHLKYVVIVSRHGVRAPTWELTRLNEYSAQPWPDWGVPPGNLTPHGRVAIKLIGGYYHDWLTEERLFDERECRNAGQVFIWADKDQRTLETGRAFAESLALGCEIAVHSQPGSESDPLFSGAGASDPELALEAVRARIGADPQKLIADHQDALTALATILTGGQTVVNNFVESSREIGVAINGRSVALRGPFDTSSTMSENLLLEYTNGMQGADLGWGRLNKQNLLQVLELHGAYADLTRRTPYLARVRGSNLLAHILHSMEQAASGMAVPGSISRPGDNVLVLVGHDTNQSNLSGMLDLNWSLPGYQLNETPPGGALVFSLWDSGNGGLFVRAQYVAQSLDQMRNAVPLTAGELPERADVSIPACKAEQEESGCPWPAFTRALESAIDPNFTR